MKNDLYNWITIYEFVKDCLIKKGKYSDETIEAINDLIIKLKREYRANLKKRDKRYLYPDYGEIVNSGGDWDSFWKKIFFAGEQWSEEDKREFIEENWIYCEPSQYDCTGQIFTQSIDVFNVPNGVVAYIRYAMDV